VTERTNAVLIDELVDRIQTVSSGYADEGDVGSVFSLDLCDRGASRWQIVHHGVQNHSSTSWLRSALKSSCSPAAVGTNAASRPAVCSVDTAELADPTESELVEPDPLHAETISTAVANIDNENFLRLIRETSSEKPRQNSTG
jgi:hypothetical protein